jgi:hypothetical protein
MKKSRMLLLFGGLFLMLLGYVAWCGRAFYLRAPMPDLSRVPAEVRALTLAEIEAADLRRPEMLTARRIMELLMHPYKSEVEPIDVRVSEELVWVDRGYTWPGFFLCRYAEGWRRVPENEITFQ